MEKGICIKPKFDSKNVHITTPPHTHDKKDVHLKTSGLKQDDCSFKQQSSIKQPSGVFFTSDHDSIHKVQSIDKTWVPPDTKRWSRQDLVERLVDLDKRSSGSISAIYCDPFNESATKVKGALSADANFSSYKKVSTKIDMRKNDMSSILHPSAVTKIGDIDKKQEHYAVAGLYLNRLWEEHQLCDVILYAEDRAFTAHRIILSCHSEYFAKNFMAHIGNHCILNVTLDDITSTILEDILTFMYTSEVNIHKDNIMLLLEAAKVLCMSSLELKCIGYFKTLLDVMNLKQLLAAFDSARQNNFHELATNILNVIRLRFKDLHKDPSFLELDINHVCALLDNDLLDVESEEMVYNAAIIWMDHDRDQRLKYAEKLMTCVRFWILSFKELYQISVKRPDICGIHECRDLILLGLWNHLCQKNNVNCTKEFQVPKSYPRNPSNLNMDNKVVEPLSPPKVAKITQKKTKENHPLTPNLVHDSSIPVYHSSIPVNHSSYPQQSHKSSLQTTASSRAQLQFERLHQGVHKNKLNEANKCINYNNQEYQWEIVTVFPYSRMHHAIVNLSGNTYIIGGCDPRVDVNLEIPLCTVFCFQQSMNKWSEMASLKEPRMFHSATAFLEHIFVFGGRDQNGKVLKSAECFNPQKNEWKLCENMQIARMGAAVCGCSDRIYVTGGIGESSPRDDVLNILSSVEVYFPSSDSWSMNNNLRIPRCFATLVSAGNCLYLVGGASIENKEVISIRDIDIYFYRDDSWVLKTKMKVPRHYFSTVVLDSQICIIGGFNYESDHTLLNVETYDIKTDKWLENIKDLPNKDLVHGCIFICNHTK